MESGYAETVCPKVKGNLGKGTYLHSIADSMPCTVDCWIQTPVGVPPTILRGTSEGLGVD